MKTSIPQAVLKQAKTIETSGRNPWAVLLQNKVVAVYKNREEARSNKPSGSTVSKLADLAVELEASIALATRNVVDHKGNSTVAKPVDVVRSIAAEMHAANPDVKRREVLDACKQAGVAHWTAHTAYYKWTHRDAAV